VGVALPPSERGFNRVSINKAAIKRSANPLSIDFVEFEFGDQVEEKEERKWVVTREEHDPTNSIKRGFADKCKDSSA